MSTMIILFYEFFKIGLFAMGGGLATLPFLINFSEKYPQWLSIQDISNMIAISESTPGPLGINMATFVGNKIGTLSFGNAAGGVCGAIITTFGEVLPSIIIIILIAKVLDRFQKNKIVQWAFYGIRATVIALIAYAAFQVYRVALFSGSSIKVTECVIFVILLCLILNFKKLHPIVFIVIAAILGIAFRLPSC